MQKRRNPESDIQNVKGRKVIMQKVRHRKVGMQKVRMPNATLQKVTTQKEKQEC